MQNQRGVTKQIVAGNGMVNNQLEQVTESIGATATEQQISINTIIEHTTQTTEKTHQVSSNIADVHSATEQIFILSCKANTLSERDIPKTGKSAQRNHREAQQFT